MAQGQEAEALTMLTQQIGAMQQMLNEAATRRYIDHRNILNAIADLSEIVDFPLLENVTRKRLEMMPTDDPERSIEELTLTIASSFRSSRDNCRRAADKQERAKASGLIAIP